MVGTCSATILFSLLLSLCSPSHPGRQEEEHLSAAELAALHPDALPPGHAQPPPAHPSPAQFSSAQLPAATGRPLSLSRPPQVGAAALSSGHVQPPPATPARLCPSSASLLRLPITAPSPARPCFPPHSPAPRTLPPNPRLISVSGRGCTATCNRHSRVPPTRRCRGLPSRRRPRRAAPGTARPCHPPPYGRAGTLPPICCLLLCSIADACSCATRRAAIPARRGRRCQRGP